MEITLWIAARSRQKPWTSSDLDKVLKRIKTKKARDPLGIAESIFANGGAGKDLKEALLVLMNLIKKHKCVPKLLRTVNATFIPKTGSKKKS